MADEQVEQSGSEDENKKSSMPMVMIIGFIAVVIVVETVLFMFMVPSADDVARLAEKRLIEKVEGEMDEDGEETIDGEESETKELSLGTYMMEFKPPGADRKHRVEFELWGQVDGEKFDAAQTAFAEREGRLRHRMIEDVRNASMDELNDVGLITRRIFATSNEVLVDKEEDPLLMSVGFKRFNVSEQ
ncbi:MAG TPA: hypothetical protein DDW52_20710 [Planctomycetaceae bacterium]|nr:hypothetical protein [Planctomycetaceae bacterium]